MLKRFMTYTAAEEYLRSEGFAFQGAPGRWLHIKEEETVYARIVPTGGSFEVRVFRSQRRS
jgi:hypothetical protein